MDVVLDSVSHEYPSGVRALDGIDLRMAGGSSVAIIGANGSGKTTLARHLDGLLRPTRGRVTLDGLDAAGLTVAQLAARVGLGFQDPDRQIFERSVRSEVSFGPRHLRWARERQERATEVALAATGLAEHADRHPGDLGAAQRKLLTIASVLAMETPIVVLDEPTTGLDARGVGRVKAILAGLTAEGRSLVLISHDLAFLAETCERVVVLEQGRIVLDGSPMEVFDERHWRRLEQAGLAPPPSSRVGAALGLGSTPTEAALLEAMGQRSG